MVAWVTVEVVLTGFAVGSDEVYEIPEFSKYRLFTY